MEFFACTTGVIGAHCARHASGEKEKSYSSLTYEKVIDVWGLKKARWLRNFSRGSLKSVTITVFHMHCTFRSANGYISYYLPHFKILGKSLPFET